jgi:hypothetical protein
MKNQQISLSVIFLILFTFFCHSNCKQEEIPVQEWTDFPYDVVYERVEPYVSNEETDSGQRISIYQAEEPTTTSLFWNGTHAELIKTSKIRFEGIITEPMPKEIALYAVVIDKGKKEAGGDIDNAEKIFINGVELVKIGRDPNGNPFNVAYFLIRKDGSILP